MKVLGLILGIFCAGRAWSSEWTPIFDGQMLLGQSFLDGKASSWQGNAGAQFTPAFKLSDSVILLPTYAGAYQGTKSATELAGGAQLFQDSQSHLLNFKGIYRIGTWKIKPSAGYRWELLRETSKDQWGKGLFDYRKPAAGLELDNSFWPGANFSLAFDYYGIDFPNYASLDSMVGGSLGREQTQIRTLNTRNLSWNFGLGLPLPFEGGSVKLAGNLIERRYPEQHLVDISGRLTPDLRGDEISSLAGTFYYGRALSPTIAGFFSCALAYTHDYSTQNHYDPELNVFNSGYYSYEERSIEPRIAAIIGSRKVEVSFSYLRHQRSYLGRLAQDASGAYLNDLTRLSQDSFILDLSIPIARGFKFSAHSVLSDSGSNMRYEKIFRYNYTISSHLLGFSYSF